jgi:hypothetical protein
MNNLQTLLVVKSTGRGGLLIQQHDWPQVRKKVRGRASIDENDLLEFARAELPRGRELLSVELAWYVFDKQNDARNTGRKQLSTRSRR